MTTEELLKAGIAAARAGDITQASKLLIQAVQTDPNSEPGWLWLGFCRTVPEQREYCFRRVLAINPQNTQARQQLELLHKPEVSSPAIKPPAPAASSPVHPNMDRPQQVKTAAQSKRRKKSNNLWLWAGAGFVLCTCVAAAGLFVLGQVLSQRNVFVSAPPSPIPTSAPATAIPNYIPRFEPAPCSFKETPAARVDCGFVIVPEDRSGDVSDTIRLAVAIYHSTSSSPKPDPILYLQGGPGGEAIEWSASVYEVVIAPLLSERDFVVFDPRGVGHSQPALECDEFGQTYLQDLKGKIPADQKASYYEGALLSCKNDLIQQAVNLSAYTSVDMAADVRDIVTALGYSQANLYGISYGTRVAQYVMRNHPEVVRSAILDSVVPVEVQLLNQTAARQDEILQMLFNDCKADPACSAAYPELEAVYNQVFNQLNAQPIRVAIPWAENGYLERTIDGSTFRNAVLWALRVPQTIPLAPRLIYSVRDGDNSTLKLSLEFPTLAFDSITLGHYISVNCHDQVFAMSVENLDQTVSDMCKLWEVRTPAPGENDPVNSDIPTLIFAGRYDPTTPPAFAQQLAAHLPHSTVAEIPNQGHAPSASGLSDCPISLISVFLQDPNIVPNLMCIGETSTLEFVVPYNASIPVALEPATIEQSQIETLLPSGWTKADYGFYNRGSYWGDVTQIGFQRAPVSEAEWLSWLSANFSGAAGLDETPVKHDERKANGLTWSIYKTSSQGFPIEIALASSHNQTLMVLFVGYKDEHDALYNTVFLPIIDATKPSK